MHDERHQAECRTSRWSDAHPRLNAEPHHTPEHDETRKALLRNLSLKTRPGRYIYERLKETHGEMSDGASKSEHRWEGGIAKDSARVHYGHNYLGQTTNSM